MRYFEGHLCGFLKKFRSEIRTNSEGKVVVEPRKVRYVR